MARAFLLEYCVAKLYVLSVFGYEDIWISKALEANSGILSKSGIEIAERDKDFLDYTHHTGLWLQPQNTMERLHAIKNRLAQGYSQLVFSSFAPPEMHENMARSLWKAGISQEQVWRGIIVARPANIYESYCKTCYGYLDDGLMKILQMRIHAIIPILLQNMASFGSERTHIIPDMSEFASVHNAMSLLEKLFAEWGADIPTNLPAPIFHNRCLNSASAIRMLNSTRVRDNDWPAIDTAGMLKIMQTLDEKWFPESCLSIHDRKRFAVEQKLIDAQTRIEKLCNVEKGAMHVPQWFESAPGLGQHDALDMERMREFADKLADEDKVALSKRFENDRQFLSPDQKRLQDLVNLKSRDSGQCAHIEVMPEQPVLTVVTMTYNHEKYIGQCLDSVLAQETGFPVRHLVLDHYSRDKTPEIVAAYAAKHSSITPVLLGRSNTWRSNVQELFIRCQSEFVALCDGDDYFLNSNKLQKQVDFLRQNPQCSLVFHPVMVTFENGREPFFYPPLKSLPRGMQKEYYLADLTRANLIQTNSVVYRWRFRNGLPEWFRPDLCPGDWYWHLLHAEVGKIGFLNEVMSVYRRHSGALYNNAFTDSVEHNRKTGMASLEAYKVYNDHFHGRYFLRFGNLAAGVLSDFTEIAQNEGDSSLLDEAIKRYPEFARHFLDICEKQKNAQSE